MDGDISIVRLVMPEKGLFLVRCDGEPPRKGTRALVALDYGEDIGLVLDSERYDPERHGPKMPVFQYLRAKNDDDDAVIAANEKLAAAMCSTFMKSAQATASDMRVPYVRLSYGRNRLFIRFTCLKQRPDLSRQMAEMRRLFGVSVNVWQMGPRDEVSTLGGLGVCGRACCCATWQHRYPEHLGVERLRSASQCAAGANGACGRYKCCLAFE